MVISALMRSVAGVLTQVCEGRQWHNICVRYFLACTSVGALVYLLVFALICLHDLHARFWLGSLPAYALAAAAAALGPLLLLLGYGTYLAVYRDLRRRARGASSMGGRYSEKQFDYTLTARQVSSVCLWVLLFSLLSLALGCGVIYVGAIISDSLASSCGVEGISYQLEHTHNNLATFQENCQADSESAGKPVNLCPGFHEAFPPPSPFVTYLKVLEDNLECAGFCAQVDRPLFALEAEQQALLDPCAGRLARLVWVVSLLSGLPAVVVGALSGLAAWALSNHDEL